MFDIEQKKTDQIMTSLYIEFSINLRCLAYLLVKRYNHRNLIILVLILLLIIIQLNSGYILKTDKHKIVLLFLISGAMIMPARV